MRSAAPRGVRTAASIALLAIPGDTPAEKLAFPALPVDAPVGSGITVPCHARGLLGTAQCGVFRVSEDREGGHTPRRTLDLAFVVLDAIEPDQRANDAVLQLPGGPGGPDAALTALADRWGNVVSATQTLGNLFGAHIMPEGTGIWLNNSLAYSTFEPKGNPMDAHAGRRKLSGDVPVLVMRNGRVWAALGTPGGHSIGQTVPQMLMNLIDFDMSIKEALTAPRISFIEPDVLAVEEGIRSRTREALAAMGHQVRIVRALGNAHGLTIDYDSEGRAVHFRGAADPRGEGMARGIAPNDGESRDLQQHASARLMTWANASASRSKPLLKDVDQHRMEPRLMRVRAAGIP
ncbi:MAG TPA: gamma-glutamyltransferase [Gemmatimonadaceae bacterium]|nr:gamma-glutamyltransferase [Gemmatimonadaceae bacterium]